MMDTTNKKTMYIP